MNELIVTRRAALLGLAALACLPVLAFSATPAPALPGDSVYQLRPALTDQNGKPFDLAAWRGQPVLISMFYSSCQEVCPMIFETIHLTLAALTQAQRERVKVVMITFDPIRDTTAALTRMAKAHHCDAQWTLARPSEADARKIAAALGVQYRRLADGDFNHSSSIQLLDAEGRINARTGILAKVDPAMVQALQKLLTVS